MDSPTMSIRAVYMANAEFWLFRYRFTLPMMTAVMQAPTSTANVVKMFSVAVTGPMSSPTIIFIAAYNAVEYCGQSP